MYLFIYCKLINIWNEIGDETKLFKLEDVTIVSDDTSGFILYYHLENWHHDYSWAEELKTCEVPTMFFTARGVTTLELLYINCVLIEKFSITLKGFFCFISM